jgi:hypothetical protein
MLKVNLPDNCGHWVRLFQSQADIFLQRFEKVSRTTKNKWY